jgi:hypothetical protein
LANALADAVAVALALPLALGLTEEAALMVTAVEPAVADTLAEALALADASGEDVCCDRAADANSTTNMKLTLNRSNTFFTLSTPFDEVRCPIKKIRALSYLSRLEHCGRLA